MSRRYRTAGAQLLVLSALLVGACSDAPGSEARPTPLDPSPAASGRRAISPELSAHTGLSHLPEPADGAQLSRLLKQHYPAQLRSQGVSGTALLDVHVDAQGRVVAVDVVRRPGAAEHPSNRAVLQDKDGTHALEINDRPEFGRAAQAALRETRFQPALKDGKPVPYKLRMTVQFDPENAS